MRLDCGICVVRSFEAGDVDALVRHADDRAVWLHLRDRFPHPYTREDAEGWIEYATTMKPETSFAIDVGGELVGGIGVILHEDVERLGGEVGYWLGQTFWGRGLATAALQTFAEYCFGTYTLARVEARVFAGNLASMRVLEKVGFQREGVLRKSVIKDGAILDQLVYGMVRGE